MNPNRKHWNEQQQMFQNALLRDDDHARAIELFLAQHAATHAAGMAPSKLWSFADEALAGLDEAAMRRIPRGGEHSIAWILWHLARVEDVTMNLLVAGSPQIFVCDGWSERLKAGIRHTGNALDMESVTRLGERVDIEALQAYRMAVGRRTREIAQQLEPQQLKQKVDPARLQTICAQGAVLAEASEIIAYWGGRTIAGLLLMPPTRHNFLHLNEALRIRQKLR
jgi:hypothetical protein